MKCLLLTSLLSEYKKTNHECAVLRVFVLKHMMMVRYQFQEKGFREYIELTCVCITKKY